MSFAGRVVVVAGAGGRIDAVVEFLHAAGAFVAVVGPDVAAADADVWFRSDPADPDVWTRVVPHVEQRLGPIDAAVTTAALHSSVRALLEPDLRRRGHGDVVDVDAAVDVDDAIRTLATLL